MSGFRYGNSVDLSEQSLYLKFSHSLRLGDKRWESRGIYLIFYGFRFPQNGCEEKLIKAQKMIGNSAYLDSKRAENILYFHFGTTNGFEAENRQDTLTSYSSVKTPLPSELIFPPHRLGLGRTANNLSSKVYKKALSNKFESLKLLQEAQNWIWRKPLERTIIKCWF